MPNTSRKISHLIRDIGNNKLTLEERKKKLTELERLDNIAYKQIKQSFDAILEQFDRKESELEKKYNIFSDKMSLSSANSARKKVKDEINLEQNEEYVVGKQLAERLRALDITPLKAAKSSQSEEELLLEQIKHDVNLEQKRKEYDEYKDEEIAERVRALKEPSSLGTKKKKENEVPFPEATKREEIKDKRRPEKKPYFTVNKEIQTQPRKAVAPNPANKGQVPNAPVVQKLEIENKLKTGNISSKPALKEKLNAPSSSSYNIEKTTFWGFLQRIARGVQSLVQKIGNLLEGSHQKVTTSKRESHPIQKPFHSTVTESKSGYTDAKLKNGNSSQVEISPPRTPPRKGNMVRVEKGKFIFNDVSKELNKLDELGQKYKEYQHIVQQLKDASHAFRGQKIDKQLGEKARDIQGKWKKSVSSNHKEEQESDKEEQENSSKGLGRR
ncbi:MAG: hypothetical protein QM652_12245 [Legionella sp.]|uniref:hypothetical protein n=1 Tax=Legionella sp. TaxID=459 RepID=UPI0039E602EF